MNKQVPDNQIQRNIQGFVDVVLKLQHYGEHEAALDLTREALGAAHVRRKLFNLL